MSAVADCYRPANQGRQQVPEEGAAGLEKEASPARLRNFRLRLLRRPLSWKPTCWVSSLWVHCCYCCSGSQPLLYLTTVDDSCCFAPLQSGCCHRCAGVRPELVPGSALTTINDRDIQSHFSYITYKTMSVEREREKVLIFFRGPVGATRLSYGRPAQSLIDPSLFLSGTRKILAGKCVGVHYIIYL